ncbi:family 43 glycosylhydrolase [Myceligenerans indicum]|uniref:Glycoside hydrolase family 43 protein n=1 Tax=Myceligenerans indicum TaxID=2593663 RepID=A0ABS1LRU1_9MICO|nr:family 43 glycosylhydrolase [Myceligenerans indicum]MBL0888784.1 glycoside hydrolase family 43 protein [Myceligenerans indicum]
MRVENPVLRGFAPDPTAIRVGDRYYLATSSFEWFPTIPLYRSSDLGRWEYAGSVETAVPGRSLLGVPDSAGIWAPALSHDGEVFWVVYSIVRSIGRRFFDLETYVCTARDVSGPWSEPVRVPGHGFDPSVLHHDGRHYLLNLQNDSRVGGRRFDGIVLTELTADRAGDGTVRALAATGSTHLLLQRDELVEGPKITVENGWFYLLLAQGGTGVEHGVLTARSRSLTGPYEVDDVPMLTTRDDPSVPLQKAGHGELVQAPDGRWFLVHLASRPLRTPSGPRNPLGRETAVQPVVWTDGWPRLAHGGWHPAVTVDLPDPGAAVDPSPPVDPSAAAGVAASDAGASSGDLSPRAAGHPAGDVSRRGLHHAPGWPWSTLREPAGDWIQPLGDGRVRLRGRMGAESLWQQSLLAQRLTEHRTRAEVTVAAEPVTFTQSAGLVLWYGTRSYYQLHLTWTEPDGEPQAGQQWHGHGRRVLQLEHGHPDGARVLAVVPAPAGPVRLSVSTDGAAGTFAAGPAGGPFEQVGPQVDVSELSDDFGDELRFTGSFAGISAVDLVEGTFTAEFSDWVHRSE